MKNMPQILLVAIFSETEEFQKRDGKTAGEIAEMSVTNCVFLRCFRFKMSHFCEESATNSLDKEIT